MQGVKGTGSNAERQKRWLVKNPDYMLHKQREWRSKNPGYLGPKRQALVDKITAIKESTPCQDCKKFYPSCCMDFDHRGIDKSSDVGALVAGGKKWEIIEIEMSKCDLVCANCHRIRTRDKGCKGWARPVEKDEVPKALHKPTTAA